MKPHQIAFAVFSLTLFAGCSAPSNNAQNSAPNQSYPVGIPDREHAGFCFSPYDRSAGLVDVMGMAPGSKVKCPYTGKVFLVPKETNHSGRAILQGVANGLQKAGENMQRQQELDAYNARTRALERPIQVQHSGTIYVAPRAY